MARLGPFEPEPHLAIAVSGGADSMALLYLAARWARARVGTALALHVDHGLRPESAGEAALVAEWSGELGLVSEILSWDGQKPVTGIQAEARAARYTLLEQACHRRGFLHLLTGHHADDQAETVAMRAARAARGPGLAGMPAVRELTHARILRPLLTIPHHRLAATAELSGVPWLEDPSNRACRFERARLRLSGLDREAWLATAAAEGTRRAASDAAVSALLAETAAISPWGHVELQRSLIGAAAPLAERALGHVLRAVSGRPQLVPPGALVRLRRHLVDAGPPISLGGCLIAHRRRGITVSREPGRAAAPLNIAAGSTATWDGRYVVRNGADDATVLGALGGAGRLGLPTALKASLRRRKVPSAVVESLPAILADGRPVACIPVGWQAVAYPAVSVRAAPTNPLSGPAFMTANVV